MVCFELSASDGSKPALATALVPQLWAALGSPELEGSWACSEQISGWVGMSSRRAENLAGQCAKVEAEPKR